MHALVSHEQKCIANGDNYGKSGFALSNFVSLLPVPLVYVEIDMRHYFQSIFSIYYTV